jgi:CheY-like chemotaxis protein
MGLSNSIQSAVKPLPFDYPVVPEQVHAPSSGGSSGTGNGRMSENSILPLSNHHSDSIGLGDATITRRALGASSKKTLSSQKIRVEQRLIIDDINTESNHVAVRMLLGDAIAKASLIAFLKQERSDEAIHFFDAIETLNKMHKSGNTIEFYSTYKQICKEYIHSNSDYEINIGEDLKDRLQRCLVVEEIPENMTHILDICRVAQTEVVQIIAGAMPRFQASALFKSWSRNESLKKETHDIKNNPERSLDILVIDDSPLVQKILTRVLKINNLQVTVASNGNIALEKIRNQDFPMILIEIEIPVISGYECIQLIREMEATFIAQGLNRKHQLIIAMSSYETMRESSLAAGADAFCVKPVTCAQILKVLQSHEALNRPRSDIKEFFSISRTDIRSMDTEGKRPSRDSLSPFGNNDRVRRPSFSLGPGTADQRISPTHADPKKTVLGVRLQPFSELDQSATESKDRERTSMFQRAAGMSQPLDPLEDSSGERVIV